MKSIPLLVSILATLPLWAGEAVTFHRDVEPVLQANCQQCHRPGEAAPMSLLSYDETRPWARAIHEAVALDRMPPWFADPRFGEWSNTHVLSAEEKRVLIEWAETGAQRGNPADAPSPLEFVEGWNIGQPDLVLEMPTPFRVPADGTIDYQYLVIPTGFDEDKWVSAAEVRPGNRAVVHHVLAYIRPKGSYWLEGAEPGKIFVPQASDEKQRKRARSEFRDILVGFAPGTEAVSYQGADTARLLPAGADIVLQLHYTASGKEEFDRSRIGLRFQDAPPAKRLVTLMASNTKFVIPPGAAAHPVASKWVLSKDIELTGVMPHMHLRGNDFRFELRHLDGRRETLLNVPKYDFDWQFFYYLKQPMQLAAGTVIECFAHFDNSPNNPDNPDPSEEVRWGDQSWEEMMIGFFEIAIESDSSLRPYLTQGKQTRSSGD